MTRKCYTLYKHDDKLSSFHTRNEFQSHSSSSKIVYLSVTSQIYTNKTYSKTKDIRDPA